MLSAILDHAQFDDLVVDTTNLDANQAAAKIHTQLGGASPATTPLMARGGTYPQVAGTMEGNGGDAGHGQVT